MAQPELTVLLLSASFAAALTWLVQRYALSRGMLDVPNARSSHTRPTPRGGGLAIVATVAAGSLFPGITALVPAGVYTALLLGSGGVALVGYVDDRRGLPASQRFLVHLVAAVACVAFLLSGAEGKTLFPLLPPALTLGLLVLGVVWSVNLFNFMDGIDGIAASQAVFVSGASAGLVFLISGGGAGTSILVLTAGACAGFLMWNWPRARIFMGDVGSGFLGFWLAVLAIALARADLLSLWTSIVLGSLFSADATVTLLRRVMAGEAWYRPHRSHAYQHLALRWGHSAVTLGAWVLNLAVVLPLAIVAETYEAGAPGIAFSVLTAFSAACWTLGAGHAPAPGQAQVAEPEHEEPLAT